MSYDEQREKTNKNKCSMAKVKFDDGEKLYAINSVSLEIVYNGNNKLILIE